ncbi:tripartite motif-containing protein 66-like isoform X2 [Corythoichthys intestinalis]|uniref:tripartite motif-containing protein 66-like isoform X2 n=1 Tax=Corythoichthys intestinalis TaxID=161448 RepID=UPI0025A5DCC3|nr:tripartite motif-containing protein 66-like isoform X2 [Corythoichthys intestinalis]XP_057693433.1 tripartite motif-containing protein 66-like isoform X2 [Corythoichthys intestinalis]
MDKVEQTGRISPFRKKKYITGNFPNNIRIRPEDKKILDNSCKAVVRLERLNLVSLVRHLCQNQAEFSEECLDCSWRDDINQNASNIVAVQETEAEPDTFFLDPDRRLITVLQPQPEDLIYYSKCEEPFPTREGVQNCTGERQEMESEDFCAVCLNGGDLLCCDLCPKVYHLACHLPSLLSLPTGDWACSLCRTDNPGRLSHCEKVDAPYALSDCDQGRCEKLTLLLYVHPQSAPFHEPVSHLVKNYYQVIRRPVDLSLIRRKLDKSNTLHYFMPEHFVHDVLLMLKNCATFNYPDSEVARAGRNLEVFFLSKLREIFPDRRFPSACRDRMERARLWWRREEEEGGRRRKRCFLTGKKSKR